MFNLLCNLTRPHEQRIRLLNRWELLAMYHHHKMYSDHSHENMGNLLNFICHVTSHDHEFQGFFDAMGVSPAWYITALPTLMTIDTVVLEIYWLHLVMWFRKTTWLNTIWLCKWEPLMVGQHPAIGRPWTLLYSIYPHNFGGYRRCGSGDIIFLFIAWSRETK